MVNGRLHMPGFGPHTKDAQTIAEEYLAKKRLEIRLGKFGMEQEIESKKFIPAAEQWFKEWSKEKLPDGKPAHTEAAIAESKRVLEKEFYSAFSKNNLDDIRPIDIERWRERRTAEGASGTTLNRYQALLSSMFGSLERWMQTERIKPAFKLPIDKQSGKVFNPCMAVDKAPTVKRERVLTEYEAKKLKLAFAQLNDLDGWEICKLALSSVLSLKDLKHLELGQEIDIERAKTGVPINIPLAVLAKFNWTNWRKRWEKAREVAGLVDCQFRDLRKTGINNLKGKFDLKFVSEYAGHADEKTTERSYMVKQSDKLIPLANYMKDWVDGI